MCHLTVNAAKTKAPENRSSTLDQFGYNEQGVKQSKTDFELTMYMVGW